MNQTGSLTAVVPASYCDLLLDWRMVRRLIMVLVDNRSFTRTTTNGK